MDAAEFMRDMRCDADTLYRLLSESMEEYLWICDPRTATIRYSSKLLKEFDLPGEVVKDPLPYWEQIVHPDDWPRFYDSNIRSFSGELTHHVVEFRARNRKGQWVWLQCRGTVLAAGGEAKLFGGYISNLGRRNKVDHQTGLYSKYEFRRRVEALLRENSVPSFGLLLLSIANLGRINELYNWKHSDEILRHIAQQILSVFPSSAEIYRMDGDEFGVLCKDDPAQTMKREFQRVQNLFRSRQAFQGKKYTCIVYGGCCVAPQDGAQFGELFYYAECALNWSKRSETKKLTYYSERILVENQHVLQLSECLRESVEHDFEGFYLVYQPQFSAQDKAFKGVEALLRWSCRQYPSVGPGEFVPILEESGLIDQVGRWVLQEAVETCRSWNRYEPELHMSVNISNLQVHPAGETEEELFAFIARILKEKQVRKENIILEFTESSMVFDAAYLHRKMRGMRDSGVKIAIDDFGVGYSSLGLLKSAPVDFVKLDKTFVDHILDTQFDPAFIRMVTALCHSVGIEVVQEGVETAEQYQLIRQMEVDSIQGFYFDRPKSAREIFERYIQKA